MFPLMFSVPVPDDLPWGLRQELQNRYGLTLTRLWLPLSALTLLHACLVGLHVNTEQGELFDRVLLLVYTKVSHSQKSQPWGLVNPPASWVFAAFLDLLPRIDCPALDDLGDVTDPGEMVRAILTAIPPETIQDAVFAARNP